MIKTSIPEQKNSNTPWNAMADMRDLHLQSEGAALLGVFLLASAAALLATGCSDDETQPPYTGGAGGPGAIDVTGTAIDTHVTEGGDLTRPLGPDDVTISALIPDGGGGFATLPGTLQADGTFRIPDVPEEGTFYLRVQYPGGSPAFFVTSAREIDLGRVLTGRPDAAPVTVSPTEVILNADGLSPWQDTDHIEIYSLGADAFLSLNFLQNAPLPGATTLTGATADASEFSFAKLIDGSKGDLALLTQLVTRDAQGIAYTSVDKVFAPGPFTQADGQAVTLEGTFTSAPLEQIAVDWKRSAFDALATAVHPAAVVNSQDIWLYAETGGPTRTTLSIPPTVLRLSDPTPTDVSLDLTYGNPFPSGWAVAGGATANYRFQVEVPGMPVPKMISAAVSMDMAPGAPSASFAPVVGPVKDLKVNGMPVTSPLAGVGKSPVVSWSAPDLGTPECYSVAVRRFGPSGSRPSAGSVRTTETSVTIPPGILEEGLYYYLRVIAFDKCDPAKPLQVPPESGFAEAVTHLISM